MVAPNATRVPMIKTEEKFVLSIFIAANEAINTFEGPKNGIILNPKDVMRTSMTSSIVSIFCLALLLSHKLCDIYKEMCISCHSFCKKCGYLRVLLDGSVWLVLLVNCVMFLNYWVFLVN